MIKLLIIGMLLSPPLLRTMFYYRVAVPYQGTKFLSVESNVDSMADVFDALYKQVIILGLEPNMIFFECQPQNTDEYLKMWDLSQAMSKAL